MTAQNQKREKVDVSSIEIQPNRRTIYFVILYILFIFDFLTRNGINVIFPFIQDDLQLTDTQVGSMGSAVLLAMAIFVLPVSFLSEKYSQKRAITACTALWTLGSFFSGMATNFQTLIASRFCVGMGNSAYAPMSNSLLTTIYPQKMWGKKVGIYNTAMTVSVIIGSILFAKLAEYYGWRVAFYVLGAMSIVPALASFILPDKNKLVSEKVSSDNKSVNSINFKSAFKTILTNKALLGVCLGAAGLNMVMLSIISWQSIFFVREMGASITTTASYITIAAICSALGYPIGGAIVDKWCAKDRRGRVLFPATSITISFICFIIGFKFFLPAFIFIGAGCATAAYTSCHVATQELVPIQFKSISYSTYTLCIQGCGALGPVITGILSEKFGLVNALVMMQICIVIGIILFILVSRVYVKQVDQVKQLEKENSL